MSQFAVIGLGRFGSTVARLLFQSGHEVLAVDNNDDAVQRMRDVTTRAVVLDARDKQRLRVLGLQDFDVVIVSLGDSIEASVLISLHLKDLGVKRIIAKANTDDHARLLDLIGVDEIISPEKQAAERVASRLRGAGALDFIPLGDHYSILEVTPAREFVDSTLAELKLRNRFQVQVIAVRDARTDQVTVSPPPDFTIRSSHILVVLGANENIERLREHSAG